MSKYSIESTKQKPFKPGLLTPKIKVEAITDKGQEMTEFILTIFSKRKTITKTFPIKEGKSLKAFRELEGFVKKNYNKILKNP